MGRMEELIAGYSEVLKGTVTEMERDKFKRYFDFHAPFLGDGQWIYMTAMERPSGTIDFGFNFLLGQITSPNCCLELLKMNYYGIKGPYFVGIQDATDPPAYLLWLKYNFYVSALIPIQEAINVFRGDFLALVMPAKWPEGVIIWSEKEET